MLDIMHIIESSLGLTIGGLLIKAIEKACSRSCFKSDVQIVSESKEPSEVVDNVSDITEIPQYDRDVIAN